MTRKEYAIELRKAGYSYSHIVAETGLSKSTLSYHLALISYTPNRSTLKKLNAAQVQSAATKARQKRERILKANVEARREIQSVTERDLLIAGVALYIGEGSKTQDTVRLVNSDERVINLFIKWLHLLGVPTSHISLRIHGYPETDIAAATKFWLSATGLSKNNVQRACIDERAKKDRKRSGVHKHGTAHVTVRANNQKEFGSALARKIRCYMDILLSCG